MLLCNKRIEGLLLSYHVFMIQYYLSEGVRAVFEDGELFTIGKIRCLIYKD
jgi:hypothetical protein